ncbi:hypothetical protein ACIA49_13125 [Kribbella sp. NPDC051587]|uniref:hypothetical protein n=1 Tax=Kribbella sp. NPDC051587 TaxID=3364119 RepID=UPI00378869ED
MVARTTKAKRARGSIRKLPSGSLQVRVYVGVDPVTKDDLYLSEIVPVGDRGRQGR